MRLDRVFVDLPIDQVRLVLLALSRRLDGGLDAAQGEEFSEELAGLQEEDDLLLERTVAFDGEELPFIVDVLGHDTETFELVFIVPKALALLVQEELQAACGVSTMRLISGDSGNSSEPPE
jgi:hypothetical protein